MILKFFERNGIEISYTWKFFDSIFKHNDFVEAFNLNIQEVNKQSKYSEAYGGDFPFEVVKSRGNSVSFVMKNKYFDPEFHSVYSFEP